LNFELSSPARAKFGSSLFTHASAVFDLFGQIVTAIIRAKTELPNFGRLFHIGVSIVAGFIVPLIAVSFDVVARRSHHSLAVRGECN
jgi:hypothetical protein